MSGSVNFSIRKGETDDVSYEALLEENDYALEYTFGPAKFVYVNYLPIDRLKFSSVTYRNLVLQLETKTQMCKHAEYDEKCDYSERYE